MKPISECRLYAFVDTAFLGDRSPTIVAQQLCDGGADLIQLRAKGSTREQVLDLARAILPITRRAGVGLVVNDHVEAALAAGAEFCHLGQEDFFNTGRQFVSTLIPAGSGLGVGLSSHAPSQATRAIAAGADYLGVGPVFPTGTKPGVAAVTLDYVRWAAAHVSVPWFAIGGITLDNLDQVLDAGARRICAISAILNTRDVAATCREFQRRLSP